MRPLTLHASALSNDEYELYTASFQELVDEGATHRSDAYYEETTIGVREARAWLRGRYSELNAADLDLILKLFCPALARTDVLNGGQFFAVLRLLTHVLGGANVDQNLIFVQADPTAASRPSSPSKIIPKPVRGPPPPRHPPSRRQTQIYPKSTELPSSDMPMPDNYEPVPPPSAHKRAFSMSADTVGSSRNPFTGRSKTEEATRAPPAVEGTSAPTTSKFVPTKTPPLPPRKPANLAPPFRSSFEPASMVPDLIPRKAPPPIPSSSSASIRSNLVSPLIQASLQASKVAQITRQTEDRLGKERVMHVLKSSSPPVPPIERSGRSLSPSKSTPTFPRMSPVPPNRPPLPVRRPSSPTAYTPSVSSSSSDTRKMPVFPAPEPPSIASNNPFRAKLGRSTVSVSPSRRDPPPPTHPDRKPQAAPGSNDTSPNATLGRSKSLRSTSSSAVPTPPPRRRRPESVQIGHNPLLNDSPFGTPPHSAVPDVTTTRTPSGSSTSGHGRNMSRHLSLALPRREEISPTRSSIKSGTEATFAHLQRRFEDFGVKAEAALFKAEAGFSPRRGYIPHVNRGRSRADETALVREHSIEAMEVDRDEADSGGSDREKSRAHPLSPGLESGWSRI